ncbi:MAG: beta-ketoacyl-ACP synthase II [Dehalococcoidales bacterium]|nr:beta-ketoacyl-ACP synthase II [Dehalococcoidales bacterium]
MDYKSNRVVITGIGMISPLGLDANTTWTGLVNGKSGIDYVTQFDARSLDTKFGGEIKGFDPNNYMSSKDARRADRFAQLAVAASKEALEQSRLEINNGNEKNIGVIIGSGIGGLTTLYEQMAVLKEKGPDRVSPFLVPMMIGDMAAGQVSIALGAKGPALCTTSACASGADAIGAAYELIKHGEIKAMIAGGSESIMNEIGFAGFNALRALSTRNDNPQTASRPFDMERDGFVIGEGAGVLVLENLEYAIERGANILAEILSYGACADAYHITQPREDAEGATSAMKIALDKAGLQTTDIDYINAHGTSTPLNDKTETKAIKKAFGDYALKVPVSSTKSMTGHLIGAAGAVEAAICVFVILNGIIPPTINYSISDPDCDLDYVPNTARKASVTNALSNSFGFGGHNSTLIISKYNAERN